MTKIKLAKIRAKAKNFFISKLGKWFLSLLVLIVVLSLLFLGRSLIFAAFVDKTPIFRLTLIKELERQGGSQVLEDLIDKALVSQEVKKAKVAVTDEEVNAQIKNIEDIIKSHGLTLEYALKFKGMTKNDLFSQIKRQETIKKLLISQISVSDQEVKDYFEKNKATFPAGSVLDKVKDQIKDSLLQQKLSTKYSEWLAEIRAKARIYYFLKF